MRVRRCRARICEVLLYFDQDSVPPPASGRLRAASEHGARAFWPARYRPFPVEPALPHPARSPGNTGRVPADCLRGKGRGMLPVEMACMSRLSAVGRRVTTIVAVCASAAFVASCSGPGPDVRVSATAGDTASTPAPVVDGSDTSAPTPTLITAATTGPTTTSTAPSTTTTGSVPRASSTTTTTTVAPTTTTSASSATTTTLACRNSSEPACGPFRYDPEPPNGGMTVEVIVGSSHARPGEEVTFDVTVHDDGPVRLGHCVNTQWFGDEEAVSTGCMAACTPSKPPRYGPWDPPPPKPMTYREVFKHVYEKPGTYVATFAYNRASDCSSDPYRSTGQSQVEVTVSP